MTSPPVDLTISCVLYKTDRAEIELMRDQVAAIPLRTHLYLIDNSPDLPPSKSTTGNVTTIATGANLGYGRAHNIAIRQARNVSEFHLIANTDVLFSGDSVVRLLEHLKQSREIGLVAPKVLYPDGTLQHLCRLLPRPADLVAKRFFGWSNWGRRRHDRYELKDWNYDFETDIPFLSGCFLLTRHDILKEINGFDERFFLYFEDLDLSRRINNLYRTVFYPEAIITHLYRSKISTNSKLLMYLMVSGVRYFTKWGWWSDPSREKINAQVMAAIADHRPRVSNQDRTALPSVQPPSIEQS